MTHAIIQFPDQIDEAGEALAQVDRLWRAANYLSVGQIYLLDNPLLKRPLAPEHIKPRLLGHWGTAPGLNFVYAHLNRIIRARDVEALFVCGPGHGAAAVLANGWLEGSYTEVYPLIRQDETGMRRLFRQFSFPGGVSSHAGAETPGSIHEGGELGYSLMHATGAALDNPDLIVACVIGDGEAETAPLAASWQGNRVLSPVHDGAVLPILHVNGYKIAAPTVLGRMDDGAIESLFRGHGYAPLFVTGSEPERAHRDMAAAMDRAFDRIAEIQAAHRRGGASEMPTWPMIVLRTPKGWTGPKEVDGERVEGFWRAHQVPVAGVREDPGHRDILERWLRSYRPAELFDPEGRPYPDLRAACPAGDKRMGASPYANGGRRRMALERSDWRDHAVSVCAPGSVTSEATRVLGGYLAAVMRLSAGSRNFRMTSPDETCSNRLDAVFAVTDRAWQAPREPYDVHLAEGGRVLELLSEHLCQGWLEGYLLTGRHGLFNCYEAFVHVIDSMLNQHAKWLKVARRLDWRAPVPSFNYLLTSHVWRQDHNGFSHQDPGFIDLVANKKADTVRIYLPPDANCLLRTIDHCLATHDRINVVVAGKQPAPQWLSAEEAEDHCAAGAGIWGWAGSDRDGALPDVVLGCAGDVPTLETVAAADLLRRFVPDLAVRVVNVVDLMALQSTSEHPHGLSDADFDSLFTHDRPVIFAHHGYPHLIHRLIYRRRGQPNFHVHGFIEEGTTTTPFDMLVRNRLDRYHLAIDAIDCAGQAERAAAAKQRFRDTLTQHRNFVEATGDDLPEVRDWRLP